MRASSTGTSPSPSNFAQRQDLVVLGTVRSRRLELLEEARAKRGLPPARLLPYLDYLRGHVRLADVLRAGCMLRVESPGQDFDVERAILAEGANDVRSGPAMHLDRREVETLAFDRGRIHAPKQWFAGWSRILRRLRDERAGCVPHCIMNDEDSIAALFDKAHCHERLRSRGIPCPAVLGPVGCYRELRARMAETRIGRVFIKLRYGSSASGIVALESNGRRTQAYTTVETVESSGKLLMYNSRRVRRMTDETSIGRLVDALAAEDVHVEQWAPKAGLDGRTFDLRVVVINGNPGHVVVRLSTTPMTNLHLGSRRACASGVRSRMGENAWESLLETCRQVSEVFSGCQYVGVDLAVLPGYRRHVVFEVNAFGDLLPGVLDGSGRDTYLAETDALDRSICECAR